MNDVSIITISPDKWTKIEGFSSKGRRVKSWYERIEDKEVFLYKEPKVLNAFSEKEFITKEIWTEFIAYKIGTLLGLDIPMAIPASLENNFGILIKNFLERGEAGMPVNELIEAKEILINAPNITKPHNLESVKSLLTLDGRKISSSSWYEYIKMLIFDCLIGNNDRHDENWGLLYDRDRKLFKLAPIYDNASCLTSGESEERVSKLLSNSEMLDKYITKGRPPNLYLSYFDEKHYNHFEIMQYLVEKDDNVTFLIDEMLKVDYLSYTKDIVEEIQQLDVPENHKLADNRKELILRILELRHKRLKDLVNVHN